MVANHAGARERASWARVPRPARIGLGGHRNRVAVIVAIDVAIDSSRRAFDLSLRAVSGAATHRIVGGVAGVDERALTVIYRHLPFVSAAAVVEGQVRVLDGPAAGSWLRGLGVDPLAAGAFANVLASQGLTAGGLDPNSLPHC